MDERLGEHSPEIPHFDAERAGFAPDSHDALKNAFDQDADRRKQELLSRFQNEKATVLNNFASQLHGLPRGYEEWFGKVASQYNASSSDTEKDIQGKLLGLDYLKNNMGSYMASFHAIEASRSSLSDPNMSREVQDQLEKMQNQPFTSAEAY